MALNANMSLKKPFHVKAMHRSETSQRGQVGESIACTFLERKGFTILERNYRKPWGEIDIVASRGKVVHFVEVKTVSEAGLDSGSREIAYRPEEMVTEGKLRKVVRTATLYMEAKGDRREFQIDAIGVLMDDERRIARCRFFEQVLG